jgi:hypothetical protein
MANRIVKTSYGREYEILAGPFIGNNGTFYVTASLDDGIIELKQAGVIAPLEEVTPAE